MIYPSARTRKASRDLISFSGTWKNSISDKASFEIHLYDSQPDSEYVPILVDCKHAVNVKQSITRDPFSHRRVRHVESRELGNEERSPMCSLKAGLRNPEYNLLVANSESAGLLLQSGTGTLAVPFYQ